MKKIEFLLAGTKQPLARRKLAGKIIILQNDNTARKKKSLRWYLLELI